jgi:hypothetical protein
MRRPSTRLHTRGNRLTWADEAIKRQILNVRPAQRLEVHLGGLVRLSDDGCGSTCTTAPRLSQTVPLSGAVRSRSPLCGTVGIPVVLTEVNVRAVAWSVGFEVAAAG